MKNTHEEALTIENWLNDFNDFLAEKKFGGCEVIIENAGDLGYQYLATRLHQRLNAVKNRTTAPKVFISDSEMAHMEGNALHNMER